MARFTLLLLGADGHPTAHSTHDTLQQAINQSGITAPGQGWRIMDTETGQIVGAGVGKISAHKGKLSKPPTAKKKKELKRIPARQKRGRSQRKR
jgi:hypothetical protein